MKSYLNIINDRWEWFNILVSLIGIFTVLLIYSLRSIWSLINKTLDSVLNLQEHSFTAVCIFLLVLLSTGILNIFYITPIKKAKGEKISKIMITLLFSQLLLYIGILTVLYPQIFSMYLSQLPLWLWRSGTVIPALILVTSIGGFLFIRFGKDQDSVIKAFIVINSLVLFGVLCMGYVAFTVRGPSFGNNNLDKMLAHPGSYFNIDTKNVKRLPENNPNSLKPDISLPLDTEYGGNYLTAGDLTGDGIVEIITLKYWVEPMDINRIKSIAIQSLLTDSATGEPGRLLWKWESDYPAPGDNGNGRGSSAAIAVFDLKSGKENGELLMATDGWLYKFTFDETGFKSEKKVATGTVESSDCLIIANLDGSSNKHILIKDAYHTIWAYDKDLNLKWKIKNPGGYLLAHRIAACDLDNDGKDEIITGASILNGEGKVINTLHTESVKLWYGGHIDGIVPIEQNGKWYISVTYCDALGFALFDSKGELQWEVTGEHFEYLTGGYFFNTPELRDQFQLVSKVHYKEGNPQVMINQNGQLLGVMEPSSPVFPVDWNGDGFHEMVFAYPASIFSEMSRIADLYIPGKDDGFSHTVRVADLLGIDSLKPDGIPDIAVRSEINDEHFLHIFVNKHGKKPTNYVYPGLGWELSSNYFTKYFEYER